MLSFMNLLEKAPTASDWWTQWHWSWLGICGTSLFLVVFLVGWFRSRKAEHQMSLFRVGIACVAALIFLYVTCGPVGVYSLHFLWCFALRLGVITAVVPLGLAVGRPVEALEAMLGSALPRKVLHGRVARVLMYPAVSSVLALVSMLAVFFTGYGQAAATHSGWDAVLVLHLLGVGLCVVLPLLGDEMLPPWATPGVRTLIACLDGLLDALPGIVVMTSSSLFMPQFPGLVRTRAVRGGLSPALDQKLAGGVLLAVAESIGIPMLIATFLEWMQHDEEEARAVDRRLDEAQDESELTTPWWLNSSGPPD